MLNCPMRHLRDELMKDYLKDPNSAKVTYLIELWQERKNDELTARALVDVCCDKSIGGVRSVIENSLKYGPDGHGGK